EERHQETASDARQTAQRQGGGPMTLAARPRPAVSVPAPRRMAGGHIIEPMLSLTDLARILSCSRRLIERMRSAGRLPRPDLHVGRMPRWRAETIRRWIEAGGRQ